MEVNFGGKLGYFSTYYRRAIALICILTVIAPSFSYAQAPTKSNHPIFHDNRYNQKEEIQFLRENADAFLAMADIAGQYFQSTSDDGDRALIENLFPLTLEAYTTPLAKPTFLQKAKDAINDPSFYPAAIQLLRNANRVYINHVLYDWFSLRKKMLGLEPKISQQNSVLLSLGTIRPQIENIKPYDKAAWQKDMTWVNDDIARIDKICKKAHDETQIIMDGLRKYKSLKDRFDFNVFNYPDLIAIMYPNGYDPNITSTGGWEGRFRDRVKAVRELAAVDLGFRRISISATLIGQIYDDSESFAEYMGEYNEWDCVQSGKSPIRKITQETVPEMMNGFAEIESKRNSTLNQLIKDSLSDDVYEVLLRYVHENPNSIQMALMKDPNPKAVLLLAGLIEDERQRQKEDRENALVLTIATLPVGAYIKVVQGAVWATRFFLAVSTYYAISSVIDLRTSYQIEGRIRDAMQFNQISKDRGEAIIANLNQRRLLSGLNIALAGISGALSAIRLQQMASWKRYMDATTGSQIGSRLPNEITARVMNGQTSTLVGRTPVAAANRMGVKITPPASPPADKLTQSQIDDIAEWISRGPKTPPPVGGGGSVATAVATPVTSATRLIDTPLGANVMEQVSQTSKLSSPAVLNQLRTNADIQMMRILEPIQLAPQLPVLTPLQPALSIASKPNPAPRIPLRQPGKKHEKERKPQPLPKPQPKQSLDEQTLAPAIVEKDLDLRKQALEIIQSQNINVVHSRLLAQIMLLAKQGNLKAREWLEDYFHAHPDIYRSIIHAQSFDLINGHEIDAQINQDHIHQIIEYASNDESPKTQAQAIAWIFKQSMNPDPEVRPFFHTREHDNFSVNKWDKETLIRGLTYFLTNIDPSKIQQIADFIHRHFDMMPSWSFDGQRASGSGILQLSSKVILEDFHFEFSLTFITDALGESFIIVERSHPDTKRIYSIDDFIQHMNQLFTLNGESHLSGGFSVSGEDGLFYWTANHNERLPGLFGYFQPRPTFVRAPLPGQSSDGSVNASLWGENPFNSDPSTLEELWKQTPVPPLTKTKWQILQEALQGLILLEHQSILREASEACTRKEFQDEICIKIQQKLERIFSNQYDNLKSFDVDPMGFIQWWKTLKYLTDENGNVVKNPFTAEETFKIMQLAEKEFAEAIKKDPVAKSFEAHMIQHMENVEKHRALIEALGINFEYYKLLVYLHDAGKYIPSLRVLAQAKERFSDPKQEFLHGRVVWHDQSTADYLLSLGSRLGIDPAKFEHLIKDIVGHNDGSGLPGIFWNDMYPGYPLPLRLEGFLLALFDRLGQGDWVGAAKILPQTRPENFFDKVKDAYFENPNNTIRQLQVIYQNLLQLLEMRTHHTDAAELLRKTFEKAISLQQATIDGYKRLRWTQNHNSCAIQNNGIVYVASSVEEFLRPEFQEALRSGNMVPVPRVITHTMPIPPNSSTYSTQEIQEGRSGSVSHFTQLPSPYTTHTTFPNLNINFNNIVNQGLPFNMMGDPINPNNLPKWEEILKAYEPTGAAFVDYKLRSSQLITAEDYVYVCALAARGNELARKFVRENSDHIMCERHLRGYEFSQIAEQFQKKFGIQTGDAFNLEVVMDLDDVVDPRLKKTIELAREFNELGYKEFIQKKLKLSDDQFDQIIEEELLIQIGKIKDISTYSIFYQLIGKELGAFSPNEVMNHREIRRLLLNEYETWAFILNVHPLQYVLEDMQIIIQNPGDHERLNEIFGVNLSDGVWNDIETIVNTNFGENYTEVYNHLGMVRGWPLPAEIDYLRRHGITRISPSHYFAAHFYNVLKKLQESPLFYENVNLCLAGKLPMGQFDCEGAFLLRDKLRQYFLRAKNPKKILQILNSNSIDQLVPLRNGIKSTDATILMGQETAKNYGSSQYSIETDQYIYVDGENPFYIIYNDLGFMELDVEGHHYRIGNNQPKPMDAPSTYALPATSSFLPLRPGVANDPRDPNNPGIFLNQGLPFNVMSMTNINIGDPTPPLDGDGENDGNSHGRHSDSIDTQAMNAVRNGSFPADGSHEVRRRICEWYYHPSGFKPDFLLALENFMKLNQGFCQGMEPSAGGTSGGSGTGFAPAAANNENPEGDLTDDLLNQGLPFQLTGSTDIAVGESASSDDLIAQRAHQQQFFENFLNFLENPKRADLYNLDFDPLICEILYEEIGAYLKAARIIQKRYEIDCHRFAPHGIVRFDNPTEYPLEQTDIQIAYSKEMEVEHGWELEKRQRYETAIDMIYGQIAYNSRYDHEILSLYNSTDNSDFKTRCYRFIIDHQINDNPTSFTLTNGIRVTLPIYVQNGFYRMLTEKKQENLWNDLLAASVYIPGASSRQNQVLIQNMYYGVDELSKIHNLRDASRYLSQIVQNQSRNLYSVRDQNEHTVTRLIYEYLHPIGKQESERVRDEIIKSNFNMTYFEDENRQRRLLVSTDGSLWLTKTIRNIWIQGQPLSISMHFNAQWDQSRIDVDGWVYIPVVDDFGNEQIFVVRDPKYTNGAAAHDYFEYHFTSDQFMELSNLIADTSADIHQANPRFTITQYAEVLWEFFYVAYDLKSLMLYRMLPQPNANSYQINTSKYGLDKNLESIGVARDLRNQIIKELEGMDFFITLNKIDKELTHEVATIFTEDGGGVQSAGDLDFYRHQLMTYLLNSNPKEKQDFLSLLRKLKNNESPEKVLFIMKELAIGMFSQLDGLEDFLSFLENGGQNFRTSRADAAITSLNTLYNRMQSIPPEEEIQVRSLLHRVGTDPSRRLKEKNRNTFAVHVDQPYPMSLDLYIANARRKDSIYWIPALNEHNTIVYYYEFDMNNPQHMRIVDTPLLEHYAKPGSRALDLTVPITIESVERYMKTGQPESMSKRYSEFFKLIGEYLTSNRSIRYFFAPADPSIFNLDPNTFEANARNNPRIEYTMAKPTRVYDSLEDPLMTEYLQRYTVTPKLVFVMKSNQGVPLPTSKGFDWMITSGNYSLQNVHHSEEDNITYIFITQE